jgi:hypothetical protein
MPSRKADESALWAWLKQAERMYGTTLHMERIENGVGKGTPDVEGVVSFTAFTIELKSVARPRRESTPINVGLSAHQVWWASRRWSAGGNHWILVQIGAGASCKRYLIPASCIDRLTEDNTEFAISLFSWSVSVPADVIRIVERHGQKR